MFLVEKLSMLNTIGAMRQRISEGSIFVMNLLDEKSLDKIAESAGTHLWKGFVTFGSASAGILAIFVIVRLIKLTINTIIHEYALHSIYGCGIHLLSAIWSSVIYLFLHFGKPIKTGQRARNEEEQQAETLPTTEESWPTSFSSSENHRSAYNISTIDERKNF